MGWHPPVRCPLATPSLHLTLATSHSTFTSNFPLSSSLHIFAFQTCVTHFWHMNISSGISLTFEVKHQIFQKSDRLRWSLQDVTAREGIHQSSASWPLWVHLVHSLVNSSFSLILPDLQSSLSQHHLLYSKLDSPGADGRHMLRRLWGIFSQQNYVFSQDGSSKWHKKLCKLAQNQAKQHT